MGRRAPHTQSGARTERVYVLGPPSHDPTKAESARTSLLPRGPSIPTAGRA